jgi:hypothetical protein
MTKVMVNLNCRSAADEEQLKLAIIPRSGLDTVAGRIDHCTAELRYGIPKGEEDHLKSAPCFVMFHAGFERRKWYPVHGDKSCPCPWCGGCGCARRARERGNVERGTASPHVYIYALKRACIRTQPSDPRPRPRLQLRLRLRLRIPRLT